MESAEPGAAGERMTYGNQAGLRLLEDKHEIMERVKRLEDQVANNKDQIADHQDQIADHQGQIAYLHDRIRTLTTDAEGYYSIRHRFIDVYRRDVLHDVTEPGRTKIKEGNAAAHEGDAVTDVKLYTTHQRQDERALRSLYGLSVNQISSLSKCLTS